MDEAPPTKPGSFVEFDPASLRSAARVYGGAFQLTYSTDVALLTFGHEGASLPAEGGKLDGKNFAEVVVHLSPRKAESLASAMVDMIGFWVSEGVLDRDAVTKVLAGASSASEAPE